MRPPKVYIAGPFFNEPQLALIKRIEDLLMDRQYHFFSPRLQKANAPGGITPELADEILRTNVENIEDCDIVLAVLDWLLPMGHELTVIKDPAYSSFQEAMINPYKEAGEYYRMTGGRFIAGPLNIPDSGTVFELGFSFSWRHRYGIPKVYGLTSRPPTAKLNVMLARACDGVVHLDKLDRFFQPEGIDPAFAPKWTGAMQ